MNHISERIKIDSKKLEQKPVCSNIFIKEIDAEYLTCIPFELLLKLFILGKIGVGITLSEKLRPEVVLVNNNIITCIVNCFGMLAVIHSNTVHPKEPDAISCKIEPQRIIFK